MSYTPGSEEMTLTRLFVLLALEFLAGAICGHYGAIRTCAKKAVQNSKWWQKQVAKAAGKTA